MPRPAITGVEATLRAMGKTKDGDARNIAESIGTCVDLVYNASQRFVPRETGALAASGEKVVEGVGFGTRGYVSYGDSTNVDYAWVVHERMDLTHAAPTCAKYLTKAVNVSRANCERAVKRQFLTSTSGTQG